MSTNLVRYVCRAKVHVDGSRNAAAAGSPVTIHDGAWAYCPAGAQTEHQWDAIEPVSLAALRLVEVGRPREVATEDTRSFRA